MSPIVKGDCPTCSAKATAFKFAGWQPVPQEAVETLGVAKLVLYVCHTCSSAISLRRIASSTL